MSLMDNYEVVEVLEPEILTDLPDENFDTFTIYDLSINSSFPSNNPDYFTYKNSETQEVLLVKYSQQNSVSSRISVNSKGDFDSNLHNENKSNVPRIKNQIQSISTILHESFGTNNHGEMDEPLDSTDKEVRQITNPSPPPTHEPIFRNVNGNLVREETFTWPNISPTFPSYGSYPNARYSVNNTSQNWISSPQPYGYNSYPYGVHHQQQMLSPTLNNQQSYPAANYFNNYQYTPVKSTSPAPIEIQRTEQPKRVSFISNEIQQTSNEIYKQIEKHLNANVPKYEYNVEPIEPNRVKTSENLNLEKLNELKRVLNFYPHLIREAKVVDHSQRPMEDELQIIYQDKQDYQDFDRNVTVHKLSDLIMRSKSNSEEKLNKATQYEQKQSNISYSCCSCSHGHTVEPSKFQNDNTNTEALEIFKKVDEIVKISKQTELTSHESHGNEQNFPTVIENQKILQQHLPESNLKEDQVNQVKENDQFFSTEIEDQKIIQQHLLESNLKEDQVHQVKESTDVMYEETTKLVLDDIINKLEQNVLIEEIENNSFNVTLEQTDSTDSSNVVANTIIDAPFSNQINNLEREG